MTFFEPDNVRAASGGRWLRRPQRIPIPVGVGIDSRDDLTNRIFFAVKGDRFDGHEFVNAAVTAGAAIVIVEREDSVPANLSSRVGAIHVADTRKALGKLALAYRRSLRGVKVIGVVGSAGKTTTKRLIHEALSSALKGTVSPKSFNNDIGVPLTILSARSSDKYLVVEIGTNAPGEVAQLSAIAEPDIAVITMIGREHLEGLKSLEAVAEENAAILRYVRPGGLAVVNADAPLLRALLKPAPSVVLFGESTDAEFRLTGRGVCDQAGRSWLEVNQRLRLELPFPGRHNAINALAAVAVARKMGVSEDGISQGLARATGEAMRSSIQKAGSVTIFNDAYNANPESMLAALDTFAEVAVDADRRITVLGDMLELGPGAPQMHCEIGRYIDSLSARAPIGHAVFVGELASAAAAELAHTWPASRLTVLPELDPEACDKIARIVRAGDWVLVKGSRGMAMERIVKAIEERHAPAPERTDRTRVVVGVGA